MLSYIFDSRQKLPGIKAKRLKDLKVPEHCTVIGIDEGQFVSILVRLLILYRWKYSTNFISIF